MTRVAPILDSPGQFISRLHIVNEQGIDSRFNRPHPEQIEVLPSLTNPATRNIVILKPRQIGASTLVIAWLFWRIYTARDPIRALIVTDIDETNRSLWAMLRYYYRSLPKAMQRPLESSTTTQMVFADTLAGIRCTSSLGKGQGKGWTYQIGVWDEFAFWRDPETTYGSVTSTMHEGPYRKEIMLSTPHPGLFYEKVKAARAEAMVDPAVRFHFFRWLDHSTYKTPVPEGWQPTPDDLEAKRQYDLTDAQMYWRHQKIHGSRGIGEVQYRRQFPVTMEEGFLNFEGAWFNAEYLNAIWQTLGLKTGELRIYEGPKVGQTYCIGADPSWVDGGDDACAQVLSSDGRQVATLQMNLGGERLFAHRVAELSWLFNRARVLCEANKGGAGSVVLGILRDENVPLWVDVNLETGKTKDWVTGHGNKENAFSHARQVVNGDAVLLSDMQTVEQLLRVREVDGVISGKHDGGKDDTAVALVLALWNLRTLRRTPLPTNRYGGRRSRMARHPNEALQRYR